MAKTLRQIMHEDATTDGTSGSTTDGRFNSGAPKKPVVARPLVTPTQSPTTMKTESLGDDVLAITKKTQPYAKLRYGQQPRKPVSDTPVVKQKPQQDKGLGGPASWYGQGRYMGDSVEHDDDILLVDINEASEGHDYAVVHYSPPGTKTIKIAKYSVKPYTTEKEVRKMHQKTFLSNVHKVLFERVELNELSPATLVHYAGAAERSPKDRKAGVRKALSKVLKSPEGKEELLRYGAKYGSRTEAKEYNALEAPGIQDAIKRMGQRYKSEQAAKDKQKVADKDPAKLGVAKIKEEIQLSELSKETLRSYVTKAKANVKKNEREIDDNDANQFGIGYDVWEPKKKSEYPHLRKKHIKQAKRRLGESEELSELSFEKLEKYKKKALVKLHTMDVEHKWDQADKRFEKVMRATKKQLKGTPKPLTAQFESAGDDLEKVRRQYRKNENNNCHSENSLLLAQHFGDSGDVSLAKKAIAYRDKHNGYDSSSKEAQRHMERLNDINRNYYGQLFGHRESADDTHKVRQLAGKMEAIHARAKAYSAKHGCVAHINKEDDGEHHVSDWYDCDKTIATYNNGKLRESVEMKLTEGRPSQRHPLEGHEYHRKTDAELVYIAKDAHKAAEAMKSHNTDAENKYRDQANDSATVRYFRQKNGMPEWYKKKYGFVKEDVTLKQLLGKESLVSYQKKHETKPPMVNTKTTKDDKGVKHSNMTLKQLLGKESLVKKEDAQMNEEDLDEAKFPVWFNPTDMRSAKQQKAAYDVSKRATERIEKRKSSRAKTVREAFKDAKIRDAKKKIEKKIGSNGKDKFEPDPELSTQITKQDY